MLSPQACFHHSLHGDGGLCDITILSRFLFMIGLTDNVKHIIINRLN